MQGEKLKSLITLVLKGITLHVLNYPSFMLRPGSRTGEVRVRKLQVEKCQWKLIMSCRTLSPSLIPFLVFIHLFSNFMLVILHDSTLIKI